MQNTNTVFVLMRCKRGWPEEQFPQMEVVAHTKSSLYKYMRASNPQLANNEYEEWHDDIYDYWIEELEPLD